MEVLEKPCLEKRQLDLISVSKIAQISGRHFADLRRVNVEKQSNVCRTQQKEQKYIHLRHIRHVPKLEQWDDQETCEMWEHCESVLNQLTPKEIEAFRVLYKEMQGNESLVAIKHIAARTGISRYSMKAALDKLHHAGFVDVNRCGPNGTHIKIINKSLGENLVLQDGNRVLSKG